MEFVYSQSRYGRPFGVGPKVPAGRVALLRAAFWKTMSDPDFLAAARTLHLDITGPMAGDEVQAAIAATVHTSDATIAAARASLKATTH
jgi:tripartite-type tricarboxylate transporter receptor subunit TctC